MCVTHYCSAAVAVTSTRQVFIAETEVPPEANNQAAAVLEVEKLVMHAKKKMIDAPKTYSVH